jgi:acyl carrier protein
MSSSDSNGIAVKPDSVEICIGIQLIFRTSRCVAIIRPTFVILSQLARLETILKKINLVDYSADQKIKIGCRLHYKDRFNSYDSILVIAADCIVPFFARVRTELVEAATFQIFFARKALSLSSSIRMRLEMDSSRILKLTTEQRKQARAHIARNLSVDVDKIPEWFEEDLKSLGFDSLDMAELFMELEEEFGLELSDD